MPNAAALMKQQLAAEKKRAKAEGGPAKSSELERAKEIAKLKSSSTYVEPAQARPADVHIPARVAVRVEAEETKPVDVVRNKAKTVEQLEFELQSLKEKAHRERDNHTKIMLVQDQLRMQEELAVARRTAAAKGAAEGTAAAKALQSAVGDQTVQNGKHSPRALSRDGNRATVDARTMMGFSWKERSKGTSPLNAGNPLHTMAHAHAGQNEKDGQKRFEFTDAIKKQVRQGLG